MAKKRGLLRRLIEFVRRPTPQPLPPPPPPAQPAQPQAPTRSGLERRAINNMLGKLPLASRDTITKGVKTMSVTELRWTITATVQQLVNAAQQDADRLSPTNLPLNPWWYH